MLHGRGEWVFIFRAPLPRVIVVKGAAPQEATDVHRLGGCCSGVVGRCKRSDQSGPAARAPRPTAEAALDDHMRGGRRARKRLA
jgi:hypothetical protein